MRIKTAYNHQQRVISRIRDTFSYQPSVAHCNAQMHKALATLPAYIPKRVIDKCWGYYETQSLIHFHYCAPRAMLVQAAYQEALTTRPTSQELNTKVRALVEKADIAYCEGVYTAWTDHYYSKHLEFVYFIGEVWYSTHRVSKYPAMPPMQVADEVPRHHIWKWEGEMKIWY